MLGVSARTLLGVGGTLFLAGGAYLLIAAASTSGVGLAGTFFGFFGITALVLGIAFVVVAAKPTK